MTSGLRMILVLTGALIANAAGARVPAPAPPTPITPRGGNGQVSINPSTKVYHCARDRWYGKTKDGAYLAAGEATAQGYHPVHGRAGH